MTPRGRFAALVRADAEGALVTAVAGAAAGAQLLVLPDGTSEGSLGSAELDARAGALAREALREGAAQRVGELFVEVAGPRPRLVVVGAVDVAAALVRLAGPAGWRAVVVDPRSAFADPERFPEAEAVLAAWPRAAFARLGGLGPADAVVVLSHDLKVDDEAVLAALGSSVGFVGAMGSRRVAAERASRLRAAGVGEEDLARLSAPVGLDLGAVAPGEVALSILAEVVALRAGRAGGRLVGGAGPIHPRPGP